jgi:Bacterial aa3 type cytochrome c oxidase subunit IV
LSHCAACAKPRDIFTLLLHLLWAVHIRYELATGMTMTNDGHNMGREREDNFATYASFMSMTKWGIILVVIVLLMMAIFLV